MSAAGIAAALALFGPSAAPSIEHARCPADAGNCEAATGRVIYVEAVDADEDGDAHYVLAGGTVTAPGLSVIDVERSMRPAKLPGAGEVVSAAGPVYRGSYGQRQIQATVINYANKGRPDGAQSGQDAGPEAPRR